MAVRVAVERHRGLKDRAASHMIALVFIARGLKDRASHSCYSSLSPEVVLAAPADGAADDEPAAIRTRFLITNSPSVVSRSGLPSWNDDRVDDQHEERADHLREEQQQRHP